MESYYCIFFVVLGGLIPSGIGDGRWRRALQKICVPLLLVTLLLFAALRSPHVDVDYVNYLEWFNAVAAGGLTALDWVKDPGFVLILRAAVALGMSYVGATFILVGLALIGTARFAWLACSERSIPMFIYLIFCRFFLAQEMTAIRVGVAIPLLSLSILYMYRGRKSLAIILFLLAAAFHISVLVAAPIVLLAMRDVRFNSRWWVGSMIPVVILLRIFARGILETVSQLDRISPYLNGSLQIDSIRFFSVYVVARLVFMIFVVCFLWKKVSPEERLFVFCSGIGLSLQFLFSFNGAIALRSSELFGLFDVMLFIIPLNYLKPTTVYACALVLVILGALFFNSSLSIVEPYRWILG
jgi:EpsG family